jgi:hypothetical protein
MEILNVVKFDILVCRLAIPKKRKKGQGISKKKSRGREREEQSQTLSSVLAVFMASTI